VANRNRPAFFFCWRVFFAGGFFLLAGFFAGGAFLLAKGVMVFSPASLVLLAPLRSCYRQFELV
jgi:hypothetical protein